MMYAHTLLFDCPSCNLPVAASRVQNEKNVEDLTATKLQIRCDYCEQISELTVVTARFHWVTEWRNPFDKEISIQTQTKTFWRTYGQEKICGKAAI